MDRFSSFPTEVRLVIWRYAVDMVYESGPPCVWSLAYRAPYLSLQLDGFPLPKSTFAIFQVNRESRHEAVSRYLLFKARNGAKRGHVNAVVDVFILDTSLLEEMACTPEWKPPRFIRSCRAVAWPPPLAAIYSQSWHNLYFVRKILLPSVCFTYLYRDKLEPLLKLSYLHTVYLDFGNPVRSVANDYAVKMFRLKQDKLGLDSTHRDKFHAWFQEHSDLLIGPGLKQSSGTDSMNQLTKIRFRKWKRIFLDDVLTGWEPFARKGVVGILVSELHPSF
ncbi:uncharacterized protein GGS25DRAFT_91720 [Hypoxylon fragiforme]|uniref:uncharacterized protein n=1 Tax=Hypoxylon fragiforme TaxID=63214 RepID=UPI0020C6D618|nr:uncharacterized protein GGS25DRAFT_91720 [Hypoxylon fragiforme]KAI2603399.1 hypothetical protein GGS25DRAFT_91720 [Hypoxylon fragiforme]